MIGRLALMVCAFAPVLFLAACSSVPSVLPPANTGGNAGNTAGVSLSRDIQPIFDKNCVVCHQGVGDKLPGGLSLASGAAYVYLVNVKSSESPRNRVTPGHPDDSYILDKLFGNQTQAGGSGARMPFGQSPLPQSQIDLIVQWITAGAPNN